MDGGGEPKYLSGLTADDRKMLDAIARVDTYPRDRLIKEMGDTVKGLSIILSGRVRVVRAYMGTQITVATMGGGWVFGEMGLIEGLPASASIYSDADECRIAFLSASALDNLLMSVPGLAVRFYRALATVISQKLREASARIPVLMVEEVAQVVRNPTAHTGRAEMQALPPSFVEGIEAFKAAMAEAERHLRKKGKPVEEIQQLVSGACTALREGLQIHVERNMRLGDAIGAYAFRETFPYVMSSHLNDIVYTKPRGYAGDFETLNMIYEGVAAGDGRLGPLVDRWILDEPTCIAVRQRRATTCAHVDRILQSRLSDATVRITSLAVGPGREIFDAMTMDSTGRLQVTGIDIDPDALNFVAARGAELRLTSRLRLMQGNIIRMAAGKAAVEMPAQDLVYSLGLMDYLQDDVVVSCLDWIFDLLNPGGEAIIGNFDSRNPVKAFMDYVGEWVLTHRTPDDLRQIFARSKFGNRPVDITADTTDIQLFARCVK